MYRGVVYTSLRLRSRIYNNSLVERLLFRAWLNFSHLKQASSQQHRCLWTSKRGHLVSWKRVKCTPVPGRGYAPAKVMPIHYRENLDFTPAGIRVAFDDRRTQLILSTWKVVVVLFLRRQNWMNFNLSKWHCNKKKCNHLTRIDLPPVLTSNGCSTLSEFSDLVTMKVLIIIIIVML